MSRQYFDFSGLIADYTVPFELVYTAEDHYNDSGDFVKGEETVQTMHGAIIGFKQSKIFRSEGAITSQDKHLFMLEPLPSALTGAKVRYRGQEYLIESETENAEFTGVYAYVLRWCSAFDTLQ